MSAYFQMSIQPISRGVGRSLTATIAYRAGLKMEDVYQGKTHDYSRKKGVLETALFLPGGKEITKIRSEFWGKVEKHYKRKDAVTAREIQCALPSELNSFQRKEVAFQFAKMFSNKYQVAVDLAMHAPRYFADEDYIEPDQYIEMDDQGRLNNGNWHFHLVHTACLCDENGNLGKKVEALDPISKMRGGQENTEANWIRETWANCLNAALEKAGIDQRVSHLSLAAQGIDRKAMHHMGSSVAALKRRGVKSEWQKEREREEAEEIALANAGQALLDAESAYHAAMKELEDENARIAEAAQAQFLHEFSQHEEIQQDEEYDHALGARLAELEGRLEDVKKAAASIQNEREQTRRELSYSTRSLHKPDFQEIKENYRFIFEDKVFRSINDCKTDLSVSLTNLENAEERLRSVNFFARFFSRELKEFKQAEHNHQIAINNLYALEKALEEPSRIKKIKEKFRLKMLDHESEVARNVSYSNLIKDLDNQLEMQSIHIQKLELEIASIKQKLPQKEQEVYFEEQTQNTEYIGLSM